MTREQWLEKAVNELRAGLFKRCGAEVPTVRVSVGFPSGGGSKRKAIGQYWKARAISDGIPQVFISPVLGEPVQALDVLVHELVHAVHPEAGHKGAFKQLALKVGLTGPMRATIAGPELKAELEKLALDLGSYPHGKINLSEIKKQTTRLLKLECICGFVCRASRKAIDEAGLPTCGCGERLNESGGA